MKCVMCNAFKALLCDWNVTGGTNHTKWFFNIVCVLFFFSILSYWIFIWPQRKTRKQQKKKQRQRLEKRKSDSKTEICTFQYKSKLMSIINVFSRQFSRFYFNAKWTDLVQMVTESKFFFPFFLPVLVCVLVYFFWTTFINLRWYCFEVCWRWSMPTAATAIGYMSNLTKIWFSATDLKFRQLLMIQLKCLRKWYMENAALVLLYFKIRRRDWLGTGKIHTHTHSHILRNFILNSNDLENSFRAFCLNNKSVTGGMDFLYTA